MIEVITVFFVSKGIIDEGQKDIFVYGLELLLYGILESILIILTGVVVNSLITGIIYLLGMMIIRTYTGGYHADTHMRCIILFVITYLAELNIARKICFCEYQLVISWIMVILSFIYLVYNAPLENINKRLSKKQIKKYKKISCNMYLMIINIIIILDFINFVYADKYVVYSLFLKIMLIIIAFLMICGKLKNKLLTGRKEMQC